MSRVGVRTALGAGALSTMLAIGAPMAVSVADPDTDSGSSQSGTSQGPSSGTDTPKPGSGAGIDTRPTLRKSLTGVRSVIRPWTAQRPEPGFGSRPRTTAPDPSSGTESELELSAPATAPAGPPPARTVSVKAPLTYDKLPEVVNTVGDTVASVLGSTQQTVSAVPALLVGLPGSTTPVTDVITTIEFMLTTVGTSVGTVAALPGELGALMDVTAPPPAVTGVAPQARPTTALAAPVDLPGLLLPSAEALTLGAPAPVPAAPVPAPATPVSVEWAAPAATASLGVSGLTASGAPQSFLDRAVSTLLVPISIAALAAVALPGVGGLLVICALGIRIGYRQAKAGWAIRVAGIARFAGSGPMGVVRSGSMITLHTRRPSADRAPGRLALVDRSLEKAA
ncbi:hypothetical protein [Mycobacterium adipatum]|jgi:hypothetical protein|uniref:hypothetical protein n=1 Tax=Mycobacterium adipatum TaxID=1682113 RepID=UPI0012E939BB|nr:hypothetical protein [Mycobacterium adipatum]